MKSIMRPRTLLIPALFCLCFSLLCFGKGEEESIDRKIQEINRRLQAIDKKKDSILNQIYEIELKYEKEVIRKNNLERRIRKIRRKIRDREEEKRRLLEEIADVKENVVKVLRIMYKTGRDTPLKLFLRVNSLDQLFENYHLFLALLRTNSREISRARNMIEQIVEIRNQLREQNRQLGKATQQRVANIRRLKQIKESKLTLLHEINTDKQKHLRHLNELKLQAQKINTIIEEQENLYKLKVLSLDSLRHHLQWPLEGEVISTYGRKRSRRFSTYTINNGIKIRPRGADEIHSILSGYIVYSDYLKGYGKVLIIQHSRKFYSLYGHCRELFARKGQEVRQGELIALAGDTGSLQGKSLYFEIRVNARAQDPLQWLK